MLATLVGPFLIGWWIGHPAFAAAAWGALGLTVLFRQLTLEDNPGGFAVLWIIAASAISAAAAAYGAHWRDKQRRRRADEGR